MLTIIIILVIDNKDKFDAALFKHNFNCVVNLILLNASPILVSLRGVAVITCASHAQGPRFDPGRWQYFLSESSYWSMTGLKFNVCIIVI